MKVKLALITIDSKNVKQIYNNYKKLQAGTKTIRPHYCLEYNDGRFIVINKKEYKLLKGMINND